VTDLLGVLNHSEINLNISYDTLISCSLYELQYWIERGNELVERANERIRENNE